MKKTLAIVLTTSLFIAGCASADKKDSAAMSGTTPAILQAQADLDKAIASGAQWRIIDSATGSTAVDLSKLLKVAEEKAKTGETGEANRIAVRVSESAKLGMQQSKRYAKTTPYYN